MDNKLKLINIKIDNYKIENCSGGNFQDFEH